MNLGGSLPNECTEKTDTLSVDIENLANEPQHMEIECKFALFTITNETRRIRAFD